MKNIGQYFEPILEYLRTGDLIIPQHLSREAVQREADFYAIPLPSEKKTLAESEVFILLNY
jgi:hypothetical protein